ncbi:hypothetical protein P7C70_g9181, partial [Phenoliferia sp. Uapishka_3]
MPTDQARTAEVLDLLKVPWELEKAESGATLVITGILVDARKGTASLADEALLELIRKIYAFLTDHGRCPQLRAWRELAGHLNWSLTVFPLIRPLVNPIFAKLSLPSGKRKKDRYAPVWHNDVVKASLRDIVIHLSDPTPLDILDTGATQWTREEADVIIYTDACKHCDDGTGAGLGFYYEYQGETHLFFSRPGKEWESIIFAEAITVVAALLKVIARLPNVKRVLILCDNSPSVYGFDTGAANDSEFCPLRQLVLAAFMAVRFKTKFDFRVLHVQVWRPFKRIRRASSLHRQHPHCQRMNVGIFDKKKVRFHPRHRPNPLDPKRPFPPLADLTALRDHLRATALEKSTMAKYEGALRLWTGFAAGFEFDLLPTQHTLSLFIAWRFSTVNHVKSTLSGLAFYMRPLMDPLKPNWDQVRKSFEVQQTLRGGTKWKAHQTRKAVPFRHKDMLKWAKVGMRDGCDYETLYFVARIIILFFCCGRAGEIAMPDNKDFRSDAKTMMRHSVVTSPTSFQSNVPYMKNDPLYTGGHYLFTSDISEPVFTAVVYKYLKMRDARHGLGGALFLNSKGLETTRASLVRKIKKHLGKQYTGHSGRCGGATYYILWGIDHDEIMRLGRWKSDAWMEYIRISPAMAKAVLFRKALEKKERELRARGR